MDAKKNLAALPDLSRVGKLAVVGSTPADPCCGNCPYFFPVPNVKGAANCRRNAPAPILVSMAVHPVTRDPVPIVNGFFPQTRESIICGEHPRFSEYRHPTELASTPPAGNG